MFFGALGGELYDFAGVVRGADDVAPRDAAKAEVQAAAPENPLGELAAEMADVRVKVRGEVLPLVEVVRRATSDAQLREYRELRAEHGGDADGQLALAQWCRRREMAEEEQLHWRIVLAMEPDNLDAIKALGLREFQGMLLTPNEIEQVKREAAAAKKAARLWVPKLKKWKHAIEDGNDKERVEALRQLQLIDDPQALPSLEEIFSLEDAKIAVTLVEVLDRMPHANAADLLAWVAVESKDEYVRQTAAKALEARPYHTYVPKMLARLATPIEWTALRNQRGDTPLQASLSAWEQGRIGGRATAGPARDARPAGPLLRLAHRAPARPARRPLPAGRRQSERRPGRACATAPTASRSTQARDAERERDARRPALTRTAATRRAAGCTASRSLLQPGPADPRLRPDGPRPGRRGLRRPRPGRSGSRSSSPAWTPTC